MHPKSLLMAALLLAAAPLMVDSSRVDEDEAAREEYARLEFFWLDIPEEEAESRATRRERSDREIRKHGDLPRGASHIDINEHVKKCSSCRDLRSRTAAEGGLWDHLWMYRRAAEGFREHLERHPQAPTADAARYHLGESLWRLDEPEKALELWEQAAQAEDKQLAAQARVRLADHHIGRKEFEKALPHFQAGASDSLDVDERLRCRLETGKCLAILGKGAEAKRVLTALAKEIPGDTPDRQLENLRIDATVYLDYPPRRGKRLGATEAIRWYEKVYAEYRKMSARIKKGTPVDERRVLQLRKNALADGIRINVDDWNGLGHPKVLYTLKRMIADTRNPFGVEAARELVEIGSRDALDPVIRELGLRQITRRIAILEALAERKIELDLSIVLQILRDEKDYSEVRSAAARVIARWDPRAAITLLYDEITEVPPPPEGGAKPGRNPQTEARKLNEGIRDALALLVTDKAVKVFGEKARAKGRARWERVVLIEALGLVGVPRAVEELIPLLDDPSGLMARKAAEALGSTGDSRATAALAKSLQAAPEDPAFILALLGALDRLGPSEDTEEFLMPHARTGEHDARVLGHAMLRQTQGAAGRSRILAALHDKDKHMRWHAIRGLGQEAPSAESVSAFISRLPNEKDHKLIYQMLKYLNRMTGARLGPDPADWAKWWEKAKDSYDPSSVRLVSTRKRGGGQKTVTRYFSLVVTSKKVIFLLDTSGSMAAKVTISEGPMSTGRIRDKKINIAKRELIKVLKTFRKDTSYNVLIFADEITPLWGRLRKATRGTTKKAIPFIEGLTALGGTNIFDTLVQALRDKKVETIYLLSDGDPSSGAITDPDEILRQVQKLNASRKIEINTIDLSGQSTFLNRLSQQNGGRYVSVLYWQ
ncbi:MAG: HEAT repeat domain-containing protein [Planctomycetota bacterium]|nr:HEAT repeat domain-containing protein [Planctomycetota bacterium]